MHLSRQAQSRLYSGCRCSGEGRGGGGARERAGWALSLYRMLVVSKDTLWRIAVCTSCPVKELCVLHRPGAPYLRHTAGKFKDSMYTHPHGSPVGMQWPHSRAPV
jgi:hypothetical protein